MYVFFIAALNRLQEFHFAFCLLLYFASSLLGVGSQAHDGLFCWEHVGPEKASSRSD